MENGYNINKVGRVILPLVIDLGISLATAVIAGSLHQSDTSLITVAAALVSLPVFRKIWKRDRALIPSAVKKQEKSMWFFVSAFACGILASCVGSFLLMQSGIREMFSNQVQEELFSSGILLQIVGLGVIVPISEELLYRGLVYQRLREFMQRFPAIITVSLLFALSHGNMIQILYALPMALLLHWFYEKSGSLAAPMLFHMGANLISVLLNALGMG